jgi:hypothetical protein
VSKKTCRTHKSWFPEGSTAPLHCWCVVGLLHFSNQLITPISLFGTSPPEAIKLTPLVFSLFLFSG